VVGSVHARRPYSAPLSTAVRPPPAEWSSPGSVPPGRKGLVRLLDAHIDGILAWTKLRLSNGALKGMNNQIKLVSNRSFGFRCACDFVTAIFHRCAELPMPDLMRSPLLCGEDAVAMDDNPFVSSRIG